MTAPSAGQPSAEVENVMLHEWARIAEEYDGKPVTLEEIDAARPEVRRCLAAVFPLLRAQAIAEGVAAVRRDTQVAINLGMRLGLRATPEDVRDIAIGALEALVGPSGDPTKEGG